ncbi:RNB domain-containing ribonuclease [Helicobacter kayseriensis]|uniref:RNB domain-containing ribonuclease n=1 Tax=Helicobacter kayseriensis TaxID=2905877 RepID=UPI001E36EDA8|nr:RNB domain-containing ribonuclease [Helicobacter kayseriensis]MCE3048587.1 RNB domain-containing ribonuclease [Helicobacter kayseriensis]
MEIKEFLESLSCGTREIPKKHHSLFYALQKLDAIAKKDRVFKLKEGFAIGSLDVVRKDLVFLKSFCPIHSKDFRMMGSLKFVMSGDIALVKTLSGGTRARLVSLLYSPLCREIVFLEKVREKISALSLKSTQDKPIIYPLRARQKALSALPPHAVLEIDARNGEILEVLGVLEDERVDEKIVLRTYGKDEDFPQECLTLAQSFGDRVYKEFYPHRKDLESLPFCTIDPKDAKDHDDALYYDRGKRILYIAIADVSEYVNKESALDKEARRRGFSIYLPHKSIPMLPRELSENICSLREGESRLAMVWEIHFDVLGEICAKQIYEAVIKNHQSLNYDQVEKLLQNQQQDGIAKEVAESILEFYPLAKRLREKRLKRGYDFLSDEVKLLLEDESLLGVEQSKEGESNHLVEEAMLLANVASAEMFEGLPSYGIYRIHEEMKENHLVELLCYLKSLGFEDKRGKKDVHKIIEEIQKWAKKKGMQREIDKMIIKAQNQAQYSSDNIGHFGLGFESYTHFTSPIRRYSDLCVHRVIKEALKSQNKRLIYLSEDFPSLCKSLSELEREVAKIENAYKDRKYAHWANKHLGERLKVSVIDEQYPPLCRAIEQIDGAKIVLLEREWVNKFDILDVEILEVDLASARIYAQKV